MVPVIAISELFDMGCFGEKSYDTGVWLVACLKLYALFKVVK